MSSTKNPGRFAGLLYILMSIPGFFAMVSGGHSLIVGGCQCRVSGAFPETDRPTTDRGWTGRIEGGLVADGVLYETI